jgi:hypothetical protein
VVWINLQICSFSFSLHWSPQVRVFGRSFAGAAFDAVYQGFAVDMLHDDGESPFSFFQVKIGSTGTDAIRRRHTYTSFAVDLSQKRRFIWRARPFLNASRRYS